MVELRQVTYDIAGHEFAAVSAGDPKAPLILCLHGFPEYSGAFEDLLPLLAERFHCVAPDQRGYGKSWKPEGVAAYAMPELVRDAAATLAHFSPERPAAAVLGHDWGASVAYALAMRSPDRMARLIVANGVHPGPFQRALAAGGAQTAASQYIPWLRRAGSENVLSADDFAQMFESFSAGMDMSWMTPERRAAYKAAWGDAAGVRAMVNWYRASPLKVSAPGQPLDPAELPQLDPDRLRISMPHLLVWGRKDTALLPESHAGLSDYCDALEYVEIPDADHWILHQKPEQVAAHILRFLGDRAAEQPI